MSRSPRFAVAAVLDVTDTGTKAIDFSLLGPGGQIMSEAATVGAGLFFVAFMRDPQTQFVPMQRALANPDGLMEYIEHTGSAVFACPPGLDGGGYWGQALLEG